MKDFIAFEINTADLLPYRLLYDEAYIEEFSKKETFNGSYIYFFTRVKKMRFDLKHCKSKSLLSFQIGLKLGDGKTVKRTIHLSKLFPDLSIRKKEFDTIFGWEKGLKNCELNIAASSPQTLVFDLCTFGVKVSEYKFIPEFFDIYDSDTPLNPPEIVYVGQSHDMLERIKKHKTLIKATTLLEDDEEIRLYFLTFVTFYMTDAKNFTDDNKVRNVMLRQANTHPQEHRLKINLIERFLINYFKPLYNEVHKSTPIGKDNLVKELLVNLSVEGVTLAYGVYGDCFKFWSEHREDNNEIASFDLKNPSQDFTLKGFEF